MKQITFDKFLLLDERKFNDFQAAFYYIKSYTENFEDDNYEFKSLINLRGLIDKFLQFGQPIEKEMAQYQSNLFNATEKLESHSYKFKRGKVKEDTIQKSFQDFHTSLLLVYNKISFYLRKNEPDPEHLDFSGLFSYDTSNKKLAINYILEALELIKIDPTITDTSKERILAYLNDTISELSNPKSNWTQWHSKLAEVLIVIGTLGSIVSGIASGSNLLKAKDKLEAAKETIVKTSLNLNYQNIQETFVIEKNISIENNQIIVITEDTQGKFYASESKPIDP